MASTSEKSYASIYGRGKELHNCIKDFRNYKPGKAELTPESFLELLDSIDAANKAVARTNESFRQAMEKRNLLIRGEDGMIGLARKIRDYAGTILKGGKNSVHYKSIQKECQRMISTKKAIAKPEEPEAGKESGNGSAPKAKRSTAETGVNALIAYAKNIVEIARTVPEYRPSNPALTPEGFEAVIREVVRLHDAYITAYESYARSVKDRLVLYEGPNGLRALSTRIKDYVAFEYSKQSQEYAAVKKIRY